MQIFLGEGGGKVFISVLTEHCHSVSNSNIEPTACGDLLFVVK